MWGHKYLYWADTRRIKVSTGSTVNIPPTGLAQDSGITGCSISLITFDLASSLISRPQLFIKMTDLLPAPAWQSWHRQYLQSERLSGSRHNYTSIWGNQARYGHSEIHCCSILRTNSTWFTFSISPVFPFPRIWCIQSVSRIHSQPQQPLRAVQQNLKLRSMLMSQSHFWKFLWRRYVWVWIFILWLFHQEN